MKSLKLALKKSGGRNIQGRITAFHRGGGSPRKYRLLDWNHMLKGLLAFVVKKEYDPFRRADLFLIYYQNGCFSYQPSIHGVEVGTYLLSGVRAPLWLGNHLPLGRFPAGSFICYLNHLYGRSAGSRCQVLKQFGLYTLVRVPSGEKRIFSSSLWATYGRVGRLFSRFERKLRAGENRNRGYCPVVRGVAMNPIDHPHGGGEGKTSGGRPSVTPWGQITKGKKTRKKRK